MKILKYLYNGIAWGCVIYALIMLFGLLAAGEKFIYPTAQQNITSIICAMLVGIGFHFPSIIYTSEKFSMPVKFIIHMGTGYTVFIICASIAKWIPMGEGSLLWWFIGIASGLVIWLIFFIHSKRQAKIMNEKIKDIQK